jgi:hypothetical protein
MVLAIEAAGDANGGLCGENVVAVGTWFGPVVGVTTGAGVGVGIAAAANSIDAGRWCFCCCLRLASCSSRFSEVALALNGGCCGRLTERTNASLELGNIARSKATFLWPCDISTLDIGLDTEAASGQGTITFCFALAAEVTPEYLVIPGRCSSGCGGTYTVGLLCSDEELSGEALLMLERLLSTSSRVRKGFEESRASISGGGVVEDWRQEMTARFGPRKADRSRLSDRDFSVQSHRSDHLSHVLLLTIGQCLTTVWSDCGFFSLFPKLLSSRLPHQCSSSACFNRPQQSIPIDVPDRA